MRTRYNPNFEETEFILTTEEMRDNDISIRADERTNTIDEMTRRLKIKGLGRTNGIVYEYEIDEVAEQMKGEQK